MANLRGLAGDVYQNLISNQVNLIDLVKIEFEDTPILAHNGLGDIVYEGETYQGVGSLGGISSVKEYSSLIASEVKLELSSIPNSYGELSSIGNILINTNYQNKPVTITRVNLEDNLKTIVGFIWVWGGFTEDAQINFNGSDYSATLTCSHEFSRWSKPNIARYSAVEHKKEYPGDLGLDFVERAAFQDLTWGGEDNTPT